MLEQFLITFLGLLTITSVLGIVIYSMVYKKINEYLGIVLLIAAVSAIVTGIDSQAKYTVRHSQVKTP